MSLTTFWIDLPSVKPSAIALGTVFNHTASLVILAPLFGDTYQRAKAADSKEEFFRSKEAAGAAAAYGTSIVGSAIQSYGVAALLNSSAVLSYKGAAYLGSLIFFASSAPSVRSRLFCHFLHSLYDIYAQFAANMGFSIPSSFPKYSQKNGLWTLSLSALSPASLKPSVLACS